jgi:hypothetical protein
LLGLRYNIAWLALTLAAFAYCWRSYQRLWPHVQAWKLGDRLRALVLVPIIRFVGDVAKMAGYPPGVWWRLRNKR